ncbi:hypothetical protein MHTCC0001_15860 [Flavobacteriaceae bacterium MHTCC 0001]
MHENQKRITNLLLPTILLMSLSFSFSQNLSSNVLWDKKDNIPIAYATIKSEDKYTISNDDGVFKFEETFGKIKIQSVIYETLEVDFDILKTKDTIFMKPLTFKLDEIVISKDGLYTLMLKTVFSDYALEPHKENFFLRAVVRKNKDLYKIIDFSGKLEKKTLFDTRVKPMPKKNYKVQIDNIRKVGIEDRNIDFKMFSFEQLFTHMIRLSFNKDLFDISYLTTVSKSYNKIILEPKDNSTTKTKGYYILNKDKTFKEANITYKNENAEFKKIGSGKYRTIFLNWKSNFDRNKASEKLQLNKGTITSKTEVYKSNGDKDIFDVEYIFYANPTSDVTDVNNNINLTKDMFYLRGTYNPEYWLKHEVLVLTKEMQEFINKVNSHGRNSDFRTKTNIN